VKKLEAGLAEVPPSCRPRMIRLKQFSAGRLVILQWIIPVSLH